MANLILDDATKAEYLNLHIADHFGCNSDDPELSIPNVEEIAEQFQGDYAWGASKFVIIPAEGEYVIKIPFTGEFFWDEDEETGEEKLGFDYFYKNRNYCQIEADRYAELENTKIAPFFAETRLLGYAKTGQGVYIQEKIKTTYRQSENIEPIDDDSREAINNIKKSSGHYSLPFDDGWVAIAIKWYGEEATTELIQYADENICDLHWDNYGFRFDGSPVIHDFSDFHS